MNLPQLEAFFGDLGVDVYSDLLVLVVAFHSELTTRPWRFLAQSTQASLPTLSVGAKVMGMLTKDEFTKGFVEIGVADVAALRARLPALRAQLSDVAFFRAWGSRRVSCTCPAKYADTPPCSCRALLGLGL